MTYIEFFDKIASENISACLTYTPDRVIYIGDNWVFYIYVEEVAKQIRIKLICVLSMRVCMVPQRLLLC